MLELSKETQIAICELRIKDYKNQLDVLRHNRTIEKKNIKNYTKEQKKALSMVYSRKAQYLLNAINFNNKLIKKIKCN